MVTPAGTRNVAGFGLGGFGGLPMTRPPWQFTSIDGTRTHSWLRHTADVLNDAQARAWDQGTSAEVSIQGD
jgi:hypothetical protein